MKVWLSREKELETYEIQGRTLREILLEVCRQRCQISINSLNLTIKGYRQSSGDWIFLDPSQLDNQATLSELCAISIETNLPLEKLALLLLTQKSQ